MSPARRTLSRADAEAPVYQAADTAILRVPALPASDFADGLACCPVIPGWTHRFADYLTSQWQQPHVSAAIEHAAPDLAAAVKRDLPWLAERDRTRRSLGRYINRMSTRPTPLGLLAGVCAATFGPEPALIVREPVVIPGQFRLDHTCLQALQDRPGSGAGAWPCPTDRLVANSLIHLADGYAYLDTGVPGARQDPQPVVLRLTGPVLAALAEARMAIPLADLQAALLAKFPEFGAERIMALLAGLARGQLLIPAPRRPPADRPSGPPQTAGEPTADAGERHLARLQAVLRTAPDAAAAIAAVRGFCESRTPGYAGPLVHLDAVISLSGPAILPATVGQIAANTAAALSAIGGTPYPLRLSEFADLFTAHFGQDAEVPVLEALSPSLGVGPPTEYRPTGGPFGAARGIANAERDQLLAGLVATCLARRQLAVTPDVREFADLARLRGVDGRPPAPGADVCLRVGQRPGGQWYGVVAGIAPAGAMTGRFYGVLGEEVQALLDETAQLTRSRAPWCSFTELRYWPAAASARNLVSQGRVRTPQLLVNAGGEGDRIALGDILVGVRNGQIYLRHAATGQPLAVFQSAALLFERAPSACRFLMDVSLHQFRPVAAFDWGAARSGPFTPRLELGDSVLVPARWTLRPPSPAGPEPDLDDFARQVAALREIWMLPRYVSLLDFDRRLLLDLRSAPSLSELQHAMRTAGAAGVELEEALPAPGEEPVRDRRGRRYASEVVVPVMLSTATAAAQDRPARGRPVHPLAPADRLCLPGRDWLAAHVYLPRAQQDRLVLDGLSDLADGLRAADQPGELFFVRYTDPAPHLRIRVRLRSADGAGPTAGLLLAWADRWRRQVPICDLTIRSYRREVERYGGPDLLPRVESLFCADSRAVMAILRRRAAGGGLTRISVGAISLGRLAQLLVPDSGERLRLLRRMTDASAGQRQYREAGEALWQSLHCPGPVAEVVEIVGEHWAGPAPTLSRLVLSQCGPGLDGPQAEPPVRVIPSLLHMHANRLGLSRATEKAAFGVARRLLTRSIHTAPDSRGQCEEGVAR